MAKTEKKKSNKKRLLLLIVLLVVTILMLSTATYAWFISNKTVSVDSLEVQARTANGLEISADAVNWGVSINKANLITNEWGDRRNQLPDILDHVSTVGNMHVDGGQNYMELFDGNVEITCNGTVTNGVCNGTEVYSLTTAATSEAKCYDSNGNETVADENKCNGKTFVAFDIFLKVTNDANLQLGANAGVTFQDDDFGIQNATRVAFVYRGHLSNDEYYTDNPDDGILAARALNASKSDSDPAKVYIWEPNADTHTSAGAAAARQFYGINGLVSGSQQAPVEYYGVNQAFDTAVNLTQTNSSAYVSKVTPDIITYKNHGATDMHIQLKSGVTKFRVYFWVEGQDVDTENNATGHDMKLDIELSIS